MSALKNWLKKIIFFLLAPLLALTHLIFFNIFDKPINNLNITLLIFLWLIIYNQGQKNYIFILITALFEECFMITPFGINVLAILITLLAANWILFNIFTHRSTFTIFFTGILTLLAYRIFFLLLLVFYYTFSNSNFGSWQVLLINFSWEIVLTSAGLAIFYKIMKIFFKKLRPEYLAY